MFILWKDHTAVPEAELINKTAKGWGGIDYTRYEGGVYSSEWFWSKILHVLRYNKKVREKAYSWAEHCDWIPALLTGNTSPKTMLRSRCAAGHKAMWHPDFGGLPSESFLIRIDSLLKGLRERLYEKTATCDIKAGNLTAEWAQKLGLSETVAIGVGGFDAHMGAVGGDIEPYFLSKIMGTSTCDILIAPTEEIGGKLIKGICGQVDGSVIPGMLGMEAGQSAFGDVYAWFKKLLLWPMFAYFAQEGSHLESAGQRLYDEISGKLIPMLTKEAEKIPAGESGIIALDWLNGRRTPDANQALTGGITGLNLGSDAPRIFRALVEATGFGAKKIVDRFESEGVPIKGVIALGGVAKKSPFVMQTVSDILNRNIKIARAEETCARGAAMFAAVAAGIHKDVETAQKAMGAGFEKEYSPIAANANGYIFAVMRTASACWCSWSSPPSSLSEVGLSEQR